MEVSKWEKIDCNIDSLKVADYLWNLTTSWINEINVEKEVFLKFNKQCNSIKNSQSCNINWISLVSWPGWSYLDHIWYHTNHTFFFYDLTMINLESYMIQIMVNLEPQTFMVQSETWMVQFGIISGLEYDQPFSVLEENPNSGKDNKQWMSYVFRQIKGELVILRLTYFLCLFCMFIEGCWGVCFHKTTLHFEDFEASFEGTLQFSFDSEQTSLWKP